MSPPTDAFAHEPVLVDLIVELFGPVPEGWVVDATVGGGGHAAALLATHSHLSVLGIDQDPDALGAASATLAPYGARATVRRARFDAMGQVVHELGQSELSGALFDLGVSSPQLDRAERGFSMHADGPLDMRMDPQGPVTAAELVNETDEGELASILRRYGDERFARRIAQAIVAARPLTSTRQLNDVVSAAVPSPARRRGSGHPARRTFQALRIAVNDELAILPDSLDTAIGLLSQGGRCVALTYHSGEDRIVKDRFRHAATGGWRGQSGLPPPPEMQPTVRFVRNKPWRASEAEVAANPRARAARARAVEKITPQSTEEH